MSTSRKPSGPSPLPKAAPPDPPKGWEVHARKTSEHNDKYYPRMRALRKAGLSFRAIGGRGAHHDFCGRLPNSSPILRRLETSEE